MNPQQQMEVTRNASGVSPPSPKEERDVETRYESAIRVELISLSRLSSGIEPGEFKLVFSAESRKEEEHDSARPCARARIHDALRRAGARGATFEEVAQREGLKVESVRGRIAELAHEGLAVRKRYCKVAVHVAAARDEGLVRPGERVEDGAASSEAR